MVRIRIINGTYGYKDPKSGYVMPVKAGDPSIEVTEEKAERLVKVLHIAEYVDSDAVTGEEETSDDAKKSNTEGEEINGNMLEAKKLFETCSPESKANELKDIGKLIGMTFKVGTSKADMYAALEKTLSAANAEDEENAGEGDGDGAPNLTAEVPT